MSKKPEIKFPAKDGGEVTLTIKEDFLYVKHEQVRAYSEIKIDVDAKTLDAIDKGAVDMNYLKTFEQPILDNRKAYSQHKEKYEKLKSKKKRSPDELKEFKKAESEMKRLDGSYAVMSEKYANDQKATRMKATLRMIEETCLALYFMQEGKVEEYVENLCEGEIDKVDFSDKEKLLGKVAEVKANFF